MPQFQEVFGQVEADIQQRRFSSAMRRLVSISNSQSKNLHYLGLLAQVQTALQDYSGLIRTLSETVNLRPSAASYLDLMYVLYTQGRLNEALDIGLQLQDMQLTGIQQRSLVHGLVRIYLEFCDYEGVQELIANYDGDKDDSLLVWASGLVEVAVGRKDEALVLFRRAIELQNTNDRAWVSLAMLHEEMGDRELALANLNRALDVNPDNATGLKLMVKWTRKMPDENRKVLSKIRHYLSRHDFDDEMSVCYIQALKDERAFDRAGFEIDKLILRHPADSRFTELKKNLEVQMKM